MEQIMTDILEMRNEFREGQQDKRIKTDLHTWMKWMRDTEEREKGIKKN